MLRVRQIANVRKNVSVRRISLATSRRLHYNKKEDEDMKWQKLGIKPIPSHAKTYPSPTQFQNQVLHATSASNQAVSI